MKVFEFSNGTIKLDDLKIETKAEIAYWNLENIPYKIRKATSKEKQFYYQQQIVNKTGINIVTCGNCSTVILHKAHKTKLKCFNCGMKSDICDFPDLNYL